MTLYQLKIIQTLLNNNLSVSVTAEKLHRAQSAISHQLSLLESEFDGKLFERSGKRLIGPTQLCRELLPQIDIMLQTERSIQALRDENAQRDRGELRVATTYTQARYFLPQVVRSFQKKYPNVKFIFLQDNPLQFPQMLKRGEIDFAIYAEELEPDAGLKKVSCYRWNRALVMHRKHPLARTAKPKLSYIASYPIITYIPGFFDRKMIEHVFAKAGLEADIVFSASDTEVIKTYVGAGMGIGIVAQMAWNPQTDEQLIFRDLSHLFKDSVTRVVYLKDKILRLYMRDFIAELCSHGKFFQARFEQQV